jgi:hypothetical protein
MRRCVMERKLIVAIDVDDCKHCCTGTGGLALFYGKCQFVLGECRCFLYGTLAKDAKGKVLRHSQCRADEVP